MAAIPPNPSDSWMSDLVKIGVPSLVTLVAGVQSFFLGLESHRKDKLIDGLRRDFEKSKIESEKKSTLVMQIVEKISSVENAMAKHSSVFRAELIHDEAKMSRDFKKKLIAAVGDVGIAIDGCIGMQVQVDLLNDLPLSMEFKAFLESLIVFQDKARPDETMDTFDMTEWDSRIGQQRQMILHKLSNIYFAKSS